MHMKRIKLIISDFDGVLLDLRNLHFEALNSALEEVDPKYSISVEEHVKVFDGLSTKKKLNILHTTKNFPLEKINEVNDAKQKYTLKLLDSFSEYNKNIITVIEKLKSEGYLFYIASNAVQATVLAGCKLLGIAHLVDKFYSNENVRHQKPHPEIYLQCMVEAGVSPQETLILEDSKHGREAALNSGAWLCGLDNSFDFSYEKIKARIIEYEAEIKPHKWGGRGINVLIPMAGAGSRFATAGYKLPKPLIDVNGKPMIQRVVENLNIDGKFIFVVQQSHFDQYNLGVILPLIAPGCEIVRVNQLTDGAACTTLLAKEYINNNDHLLIANSDQIVDWDSCDFMHTMLYGAVDGGILSFKDESMSPKWSFAKTNELGHVTEVAEKNPISDHATVGIYYFNRGSEYVKYAEQMISKNIRVNNEFYVCPVYNEFIQDDKKIKLKDCDKMWGIGTPDDLNYYLEHHKVK